MEKPYKGQIDQWEKRFQPEHLKHLYVELYGENVGYCIVGTPVGHPDFRDWIVTSVVVKHAGNEIVTLNSRYTLLNPKN